MPRHTDTLRRLSRSLRHRARKYGTVTIDDATTILTKLAPAAVKAPGSDTNIARQVLRRPAFRPVGYRKTTKPSRHGRPVRSWALAK